MSNYLVFYVALGETHRQMARLSIDSLYLSGYAGACHVVTDAPIPLVYAPADKVVQVTDADTSAWHAKRAKAQYVLGLADVSTYDAVLFTDCDTIVTGDVTPLLDRIAASPTKLFVTNTAEGTKNLLLRRTAAWALMTQDQRNAHKDDVMVDSSGVGFKPTADNLAFVTTWDNQNATKAATQPFKSDACGLNLALIFSGRTGDVEQMVECERINGLPGPQTIIRHYVNGQTVRMPTAFRAEVELPYQLAHPPAAPTSVQPPADQPAAAA